jgi:hypothetical protein
MISSHLRHTSSSELPQHLHNEVISSLLLSVPICCLCICHSLKETEKLHGSMLLLLL